MSGNSFSETCPNCGLDMDVYNDWKPHSYVGGNCLNCGYYFQTTNGFLSLAELNLDRDDNYLPHLKKLPKQNKEVLF